MLFLCGSFLKIWRCRLGVSRLIFADLFYKILHIVVFFVFKTLNTEITFHWLLVTTLTSRHTPCVVLSQVPRPPPLLINMWYRAVTSVDTSASGEMVANSFVTWFYVKSSSWDMSIMAMILVVSAASSCFSFYCDCMSFCCWTYHMFMQLKLVQCHVYMMSISMNKIHEHFCLKLMDAASGFRRRLTAHNTSVSCP